MVSADQNIRPILCPKFSNQMVAYAGYAEVINAGKTIENEDMAAAKVLTLTQQGYDAEKAVELPESSRRSIQSARERSTSEVRKFTQKEVMKRIKSDEDLLDLMMSSSSDDGSKPKAQAAYFGIFDGHAGSGAAIMSANRLHEYIKVGITSSEQVTHPNFFQKYSSRGIVGDDKCPY
jgi:protein phosphatase 1H